MGQDAYLELMEALRTCVKLGFWPRMVEDTTSSTGYKFVWPAGMTSDALLLDDFSGRLRSLVLTEVNESVASKPQKRAKNGAPSIREIYSASGSVAGESAIARPSDLKRTIFEAFEMLLRKRGVSSLYVIFDHLNRTPKIKRILQANSDHRPVQWPSNGDRDSLFVGDHPFRNSIHEYIVCPESKVLLWDYLATGLLDEFAKDYLPECCELVVWSGVYRDAEMLTPFRVAKNIDGVVTGPEPLLPTEDIPYFMCAEADLTILYLAKRFLGKRNIVIASKDNDFIPALLSIYSQALEENMSKSGEITSHGLYLSRKVKITTKIPRSTIPDDVYANYVQKKTGVAKPAAATSTPTHPPPPAAATITIPAAVADVVMKDATKRMDGGDDDDDDDALTFLKPKVEEKKKEEGASVVDFRERLAQLKPPAQSASLATPAKSKKAAQPAVDEIEVSERVPEVIDMGHVFKVVWRAFREAHSWCNCGCDPADVFGSICFMSGSDYYRKLYGLGWTALCCVYLDPVLNKKIGCLCPRDVVVTKPDRPKMYRLDYTAFTKLVALAYCQKLDPKIDIDRTNVSAVRAFIRGRYETNKAKAKPKKPIVGDDGEEKKASRTREPYAPPDHIEAYAARLCWVMNYYTRSHQPGWVSPSGTETSASGESLYGYAVDKESPKGYALAESATIPVRVRVADVY